MSADVRRSYPVPFKAWDTTSIDLTILSIEGDGDGRVRTAEEFRAVLEASCLTLTETIPTAAWVSVIQARPAQARAG